MKTIYVSDLKELEGKQFTDVKELEEAEAKVKTENEKKEVALAEKKAELAKLNEAGNTYLKLVAENDKKRAELRKAEQEAYEAYRKELHDFAEKHQGYHLTYKIDGDNVEFQIEEAKQKTLEDCLKEIEDNRRALRHFWNQIWS